MEEIGPKVWRGLNGTLAEEWFHARSPFVR